MANDAYTRSHDYDLVHQRIEIGDFNWDSLSFSGKLATTLVALRPGFDSIILDAGHLLQVTGATDPAGLALATARSGDTLVIRLAKPAGVGDTVRFTLTYAGKVENGRGLTFLDSEGRRHRPRQIWSQGEDDNNHDWFPTYDFPNDRMTWEMVATVPASFTAVSNGRLVSDVRTARGRTMTWRQDKPASTYLVSLIVAPLVKIHDTWGTVPVDYYVYREDSARAWPLFHVTPDMIAVYSRLTGVRYPWPKYAQTTVADFFGGMENVSATTLVDWLPDPAAYLDRPWYQYILIPHELAHQWFGDLVTTENWANMWLNEGFAEFMPGQYWQVKKGRHLEDDYYLDEYGQFMQIDEDRRMPLAALGSNNIYPKGALVLRMLQRYLGNQRFWASVKRYLEQHAYDNATTDDFRQAVLDATGENLDWFWDQWMYQAGYPEFDVKANYDGAAHTLTVNVQQTQVDTNKADTSYAGLRFTTPPVFRMPMTVRVGTASGDVVRNVSLDAREQTIRIDSLPAEPTMVIFDDGNRVLKKLTFEQPTAWLAAQLQKDPDLWNRQWVIEQLAKRTTDDQAARALAGAAIDADYFLTRAQAVSALAGFSTAALPTLEAAARDTSAAVRVAALEALGEVGGPRGVDIALDHFHHDPSYQVRGAAVGAIAKAADPAQRQAVLTEAMATESYQDAIRNSAYQTIARSADTTFLDAVNARVAVDENVVYVLAGLGRRGSTRALDLLASHLNDEKRYVRDWALNAFRNAVPAALALPRLQAAQAAISDPATKARVAEAIQDLEK
ncbi:MAG TPA: M1 family aminopeptidase [Gemmatimonadales bacterium]|jgi:aminopeptidase N|nr:M1 family aminopeptidase [Gemmatimonadales bacterium]